MQRTAAESKKGDHDNITSTQVPERHSNIIHRIRYSSNKNAGYRIYGTPFFVKSQKVSGEVSGFNIRYTDRGV